MAWPDTDIDETPGVDFPAGFTDGPTLITKITHRFNVLAQMFRKIQHGNAAISVASGSPDGTVNVTFATPFATTPDITATNTTSSNRDYGIQITAKSTTGFTARAHHFDGTNAGVTTNVNFDWIATTL
jgi:hypothetical protein